MNVSVDSDYRSNTGKISKFTATHGLLTPGLHNSEVQYIAQLKGKKKIKLYADFFISS